MLTRAELDALPLDNNVKQDVERGKVSQASQSLVSYQTPLKSLVIYEFSVFPFVCPGQLGSELSVCIGVVKIPT